MFHAAGEISRSGAQVCVPHSQDTNVTIELSSSMELTDPREARASPEIIEMFKLGIRTQGEHIEACM